MKKLKMIVTSVVVLAIVSGAFAFKAKKLNTFCYTDTFNGTGQISSAALKRVAVGTSGSVKKYYIVDWDGASCTTLTPTVPSGFIND
jgi:hypothetical protein